MKIDGDLSYLRNRLTLQYRRTKKLLLRTESKNLMNPTSDLAAEVQQLRGYLRGVQKAIDIVETRANDNQLPIGQVG